MCVITSDVADLLRIVRLLWAGRIILLGQERGNAYEPTVQRRMLMTPPVTTVPMAPPTVPIGCPMMMPTSPGGDAYVVLNDVLASLKMQTAAAKSAWFEGERGNPHTIPPHVPLIHHFPFLSVCARDQV